MKVTMSRRKAGPSASTSKNITPAQSLLNRLSGPSDQKAGLMRDPEEVKRIIYDASKGGKYFKDQQRKDEELGVKVDRLLATFRKARAGRTDFRTEEAIVDKILEDLERTRDLSQVIVVVDADAFYASVHERRDPTLKGTAFGVGIGVLTTASYEARKYGCRSAMAEFVARKLCPHLKTVKIEPKLYSEASSEIFDILRQYGEIAPASLDEAYCSLTQYCSVEKITPQEAGERIRAHVLRETGLTVSTGVSPNRTLSKIAADINKPNGQFTIDNTKAACMKFAQALNIRQIPGIGRVHERYLQALGIQKVGDIYPLRGELLLVQDHIGLDSLLRAYLGLGGTDIKPHERGDRKTYGCEHTFRPTSDVGELLSILRTATDSLAEDMARARFSGRTITLKIKRDTYESETRAYTIGPNTYYRDSPTMFREGKNLLDKEIAERPGLCLRLLGIKMSNVRDDDKVDEQYMQLSKYTATATNIKSQPRSLKPSHSRQEQLSPDLSPGDKPVAEEEMSDSSRHWGGRFVAKYRSLSADDTRKSSISAEGELEPTTEPVIDPRDRTCPVCEIEFQGSSAALSSHVMSHFEQEKRPERKRAVTSPTKIKDTKRPRYGRCEGRVDDPFPKGKKTLAIVHESKKGNEKRSWSSEGGIPFTVIDD